MLAFGTLDRSIFRDRFRRFQLRPALRATKLEWHIVALIEGSSENDLPTA
jgi:hypothetical protein